MENCFAACACDDLQSVTKADLDRFTDKIQNVLGDEKGRRLFRNFIFTTRMKDGRRKLNLWEHTDELLGKGLTASSSSRSYLDDIDRIIDEIDRLDELDDAIATRLSDAKDLGDKEEIVEALKSLKVEVTKALRTEYKAFRNHYAQTK